TQRSLEETQEVEIAPAVELAQEHRAPEALADAASAPGGQDRDGEQRPDIAELLPVDRFGALLDLIAPQTEILIAAEEELEPALGDHWSDVSAAFAHEDADHLYVRPETIAANLTRSARVWLSAIASGQQIELRAASADT